MIEQVILLVVLYVLIFVIGKRWQKIMQNVINKHMNPEFTQPGPKELNYHTLFDRFRELTGKTPIEVFLLARTHRGFGHSDDAVQRHLDSWVRTQEFPNYVEAFLDEGRDYIINT